MSELWPSLKSSRPPPPQTEMDLDLDAFLDEPGKETPSYMCTACEDDGAIESVGTEVVCTRCGSIIDVPLEWAAEFRWYSSESSSGGPDPSRCGFPVNPLMPESSLGTMILIKNQSPLMRRIKRYHMWNLMPYRERTLWTIFDGFQTRASNAGISTAVLEEAKELFAQLTASAICRGQSQRDAMMAACLWEALKRHDAPRLPKDIAAIFNIPMKQVTRGIKQFQHLFAIRTSAGKTDTYAVPAQKEAATQAKEGTQQQEESAEVVAARGVQRRAALQKTATRTTSYEDFIQPFLTNLAIPRAVANELEAMVRHVCARTEDLGVVPENTPPSLTASVIAFCAAELDLRLDLQEISRTCSVSVVTIQKCLKRMAPWSAKLLASE